MRPVRLLMRSEFNLAMDKMPWNTDRAKPQPAEAGAKTSSAKPDPAKPPKKPDPPLLKFPTASPYAVSYFTLARHWPFIDSIQSSTPGANALPSGNFEGAPDPAWTTQEQTLDQVVMQAKYSTQSAKEGQQCLEINISPKPNPDKPDQPPKIPGALERTIKAVQSPTIRFNPGTIVRISGWVKIPRSILASADGAMIYDNIGGEALSVRLTDATDWKYFELYRRVLASGEVFVTLALTGLGTVQFDDIRIEPMLPKPTATVLEK
jgi:hypothetical protein